MIIDIDSYIRARSKVVSIEFGIGEIIGKFNLFDGVNDYVEVRYFNDKKTRYFCTKYVNDIRLLSSRESIKNALLLLREKITDESIFNRSIDADTKFIDKGVVTIVQRIVELSRSKSLSAKNKSRLFSNIESLVLEVEQVFAIDRKCAQAIVDGSMKKL